MDRENTEKHFPSTVSASLEARLAPFAPARPAALEESDLEADRNASGQDSRKRSNLVADLKLLFAALGAGNSVVPLGDNSRAARLLAEYARSLRTQ